MPDYNSHEDLPKRAEELVPNLRERAAVAEELRRLPDENIADLQAAGLFKMAIPKQFGGYRAPLQTRQQAITQVSRGCASTAWVLATHTTVSYMLAKYPDVVLEEVYAGEEQRFCAVFQPTGTARREGDEWLLNGRWSFTTGQHHATFAALPAVIEGSDPVEIGLFVVPRSALGRADDWDTSGLIGTGSNATIADNVVVPTTHMRPFIEVNNNPTLAKAVADDPFYQAPVVPVMMSDSVGAALGLAKTAFEIFSERVRSRGITYTAYGTQAEAPLTHLQIAEAAMKIDDAVFHAERLARTIDEFADSGAQWDLAMRVRARADVGWSVRLCREAVDIIQNASGASQIYRRDPLQRIVRNMQTLSLHSFLLPSTNQELYGRTLCGLDPQTPFL